MFVCLYVCAHMQTFVNIHMHVHVVSSIQSPAKKLQRDLWILFALRPSFWGIPLSHSTLVLISNGHWGRGSSIRRDSTRQTSISEL